MSTAVAVTRSQTEVSPSPTNSIYQNEILNRCMSSSSSSCNPIVQFEDLESRIEASLRERDEQWRRHEKAQITFLQNETSHMLKCLHLEVNRLSNELRETKRRIAMGESIDDLESQHSDKPEDVEKTMKLNAKINDLEKKLEEKESYIRNVEKKVTLTIQKLQEQINIQGNRIRQLNDELNDRNQTVTQLSQQLRSIKLREAMATSQHRRRATQPSITKPLTSPSSPHRIFPPISSGLVTASVAVTYPGNRINQQAAAQKRSVSARRNESMLN